MEPVNLMRVDDEEKIISTMKRLFEKRYNVLTASSGDRTFKFFVKDAFKKREMLKKRVRKLSEKNHPKEGDKISRSDDAHISICVMSPAD